MESSLEQPGKQLEQPEAQEVLQHSEPKQQETTTSAQKKRSAVRSGYRLSVRGLVILLFFLSVTAAWMMNSSWNVNEITVEGNHFTTAESIIKASELHPGVKPDSLQALKVIQQIEKLPYIAEARLEPNPPASVKIVVIEREPIGLIASGNTFVILDNKGVKMPVVPGKVPHLPIVYGFSASMRDTLKGPAFQAVNAFLTALKKDPLARSSISEIGFDRQKGIIAMSQRGNVRLYFGHGDFEKRLKILHAFIAQIARSRGMEAFEWIDFRFDHQVITSEIS
jgi:cell division septal protein FtsQ